MNQHKHKIKKLFRGTVSDSSSHLNLTNSCSTHSSFLQKIKYGLDTRKKFTQYEKVNQRQKSNTSLSIPSDIIQQWMIDNDIILRKNNSPSISSSSMEEYEQETQVYTALDRVHIFNSISSIFENEDNKPTSTRRLRKDGQDQNDSGSILLLYPSIKYIPVRVIPRDSKYKLYMSLNSDIELKQKSWINVCRICYGTDSLEELIQPCKCRGSIAYAHHTCLERWLKESMRSHCELCRYRYHIIRTPKYGILKSIFIWLFIPGEQTKELLKDLLGFLLYTPTALIATYLLLVSCEHVRQILLVRKSFVANLMAFVAISVASLGMASIDFAYSSWLILRIRKHVEAWKLWWLTNCQLMLIIPEKHFPIIDKSAETIN